MYGTGKEKEDWLYANDCIKCKYYLLLFAYVQEFSSPLHSLTSRTILSCIVHIHFRQD